MFHTSRGRTFDRPTGWLVPPFEIGSTSSPRYLACGGHSMLPCMNHPPVVLGLLQGQQVMHLLQLKAGLSIPGKVGHDWGIC